MAPGHPDPTTAPPGGGAHPARATARVPPRTAPAPPPPPTQAEPPQTPPSPSLAEYPGSGPRAAAPQPAQTPRRGRPVLAVHTGVGKGKTTAALGMALRAWCVGWPVVVYQFVKSASWRIGEEAALRLLGDSAKGGPVTWHKMGEGWSWLARPAEPRDPAADSAEGWAQVKRDLAAQAHGFYVLDEFTYPLQMGWIDVADVVHALRTRPGVQHVVITGRYAPAPLLAAADLVTDMSKIKHPADTGARAQQGIDW
jgi:cob(I)alamin adenosyltransferase